VEASEASVREILFASDLSPESERAFEHARFLAERFRAALTLYHVVEFPPQAYLQAIRGEAEEVLARGEEEARRRLERRAAVLTVPHPVVVERELSSGQADVALIDLIRRTRPDLTVMATHGRKGFARFFLGSVVQQVVQHAGRPVLCVRKPAHGYGLPYERVLVPADLSPASRRAFPLAALLARSFEAKVVALHVCPPSTAARLVSVPGATPDGVPAEEEVRRFLQPEFEGLPLTAHVCVNGAPWYRIVQVAREEKIDLVVMSSQGHDSVRDEIIGSNAERVLRHAPCPVLVA
jgi:nucleotide-binding universal stress UspA family protein